MTETVHVENEEAYHVARKYMIEQKLEGKNVIIKYNFDVVRPIVSNPMAGCPLCKKCDMHCITDRDA
jgi:hypothetical protein